MSLNTSRNKLLALIALGSAASAGIGCGVEPGGNTASSASELDAWVYCARGGQTCEFTGTHIVRYGREGQYVTRVFTDGALCAARAFDAVRVRGARCHYDPRALDLDEPSVRIDEEPDYWDLDPASGSEPTGPVHEHPVDSNPDDTTHGHGDDPQEEDEGAESTDGTVPVEHDPTHGTDTGSSHAGDTGDLHARPDGPYVDLSAIPTGFEGFSTVRIQPTSERPSPGDGTGMFRNVCEFSHMNFDDALVFPGQPGRAHLHAYFGNTAADAFSTQASIRNTGNSTCRGGIANRSAYWVPAVLDAAGRPVKPGVLHAYYKTGYAGIAPQSVQPFPSGLRMIAGDANATGAQRNAYWGCFENYIGHPPTIPQCPVGQHVAMHVVFPQCWDGKNLDSADHKSHMAYPRSGSCPASHPVPIPEISFTVTYPVPAGGTGGWRLASDHYDESLPGGYSVHADWFDGWDPDVAETFVRNCNNKAVDCHSHLLGDGRAIF
jgi:hypothetical protein